MKPEVFAVAALPSNVATGHVTGTFLIPQPDGTVTPAAGTVRFLARPAYLLDAGATPPVTLVPDPVAVDLDESGAFAVDLVATDDPDLSPTGSTYQVEVDLDTRAVRRFDIAVPAGSVLDLTTVTPVAAACGEPIVQGPAGPAGPQGPQGEPGPAADTSALEAQLADMEVQLDALATQGAALEARVAALETGAGGEPAVSVTSTWQVNPQAGANPGGRQVTMETGELATSTWLRFDPVNKGNVDVTAPLLTATALFCQQSSDASNWARLTVTAPAVQEAGYIQLPVTFVNSGGSMRAAQWQNATFVIYSTAGGA